MPRKNSNSEEIFCDICFASLARKADLPRHMKTHSTYKDKLMFRCPYPNCDYANLQKCNVDTHIRIHTGNKNQECPDCEFKTVDPGSLTRHRKRVHGYVPKARRPRLGGVGSKKSNRRHQPYPKSRTSPTASQSSTHESSSSWCTTSDSEGATSPTLSQQEHMAASPTPSQSSDTQVNAMFATHLPTSSSVWSNLFTSSPFDTCDKLDLGAQATPADAAQSLYTFPWQQDLFDGEEVVSQQAPLDVFGSLDFSESLYSLLPASDTPFGIHIQGPEPFSWEFAKNCEGPVRAVSAPSQFPDFESMDLLNYSQLPAVMEPFYPVTSLPPQGVAQSSLPFFVPESQPSLDPQVACTGNELTSGDLNVDWALLNTYLDSGLDVVIPELSPTASSSSTSTPSSTFSSFPNGTFQGNPLLDAQSSSLSDLLYS